MTDPLTSALKQSRSALIYIAGAQARHVPGSTKAFNEVHRAIFRHDVEAMKSALDRAAPVIKNEIDSVSREIEALRAS